MNLTQQLVKALSALLDNGIDDETADQAHRALNAYKASDEYRQEQFEAALREALTTATALVDTVTELATFHELNDSDSILLGRARESLAEGADHLNTLIEGEQA